MKLFASKFRLLLVLIALTGSVAIAAHHVHENKVLKHVVILKFNEDVTSEQIDEAVALILDFPNQIPEVQSVEGGDNVTIEDAHKGFTYVFVMTFESQEGLKTYLPHERHLAVVDAVKPLLVDLLVVDYFVD